MAQNGTQIEDEKTEQGPYDAMIMIIRKLHCYRFYSIFFINWRLGRLKPVEATKKLFYPIEIYNTNIRFFTKKFSVG